MCCLASVDLQFEEASLLVCLSLTEVLAIMVLRVTIYSYRVVLRYDEGPETHSTR